MPAELEQTIGGALEQSAHRVRPIGPGRWSFELVNGRRLPGLAAWQEGWLEFRAPLPPTDETDPELLWTLLAENQRLVGSARFARHEHRMGIHADFALDDPELVPSRIAAACESLQHAVAVRAGKAPEKQGPERKPRGLEPGWAQLAEERGWRVSRREDHRLGVELDAPGLMNQAFLEEQEGEQIVSIELLRSAGLSPLSRRAIALFLLTLTARLHLVRATVMGGDGAGGSSGPAVRFVTTLPPPPAAATELDLALEALSLACRLGSREVRALAHESLAGAYLAHTTKE